MDGPIRLVYVEDNPANLVLVRRILEANQLFEVVGAKNGAAGLRLIDEFHPAGLLLDLDLPGISGIDLLRHVRKDRVHSRLPVLVITASVMKRERTQAFEAGCDAFIEKPFDINHLREVVVQMCSPPVVANRGRLMGE
ncbi:MAG: response regulator [Nannocystaceae bacterium]